MDKQIISILKKARAKIEKGWIRNSYAKDKGGRDLSARDPHAVRWCPTGAFDAVANDSYAAAQIFVIANKITTVSGTVCVGAIPNWNDNPNRTKAQVLAAFDKAIEYAQTH